MQIQSLAAEVAQSWIGEQVAVIPGSDQIG